MSLAPTLSPNSTQPFRKQTNPEIKVVIFSAFTQALYVRRLIQIGVDGYITKDSPPEMVVGAIQAAYKGGATYSPEINRVLANYPTYTDRNLVGSDLTERELDVIQLLATGSENKEISTDLAISNSSVQLHMTSIFGKLNVKNRTEAVIVAVRNGIVVIDD
jgi:DNA-binding NarL/FixJ family response regulator